MVAVRPPPQVEFTVDRWAPGFWPEFFDAASAGFHRGGGGRVSSWYRTPGPRGTNAAANGSPDSQHLAGSAFDVVANDPARMVAELRLRGFVVVPYDSHVHAQAWPPSVARRSGLLAAMGA